jgi:hypothetical protein
MTEWIDRSIRILGSLVPVNNPKDGYARFVLYCRKTEC